jgi:tetraacyldisaccharide-1-P 4'-kinase
MKRDGRGFDLVILDDAYQHWKIQCDRYVVAVTDSEFGDRVFRESYSVIDPTDVVVLTKGDHAPESLQNHPHLIRARYRLRSGDPSLKYRFVTAIADPESARESFKRAGYAVHDMSIFPDH